MEFTIAKNSNLPVLKMQLVNDGITDPSKFSSFIENSLIYFSMKDSSNGLYKIQSAPAGFVNKTFTNPDATPEYYIFYKFTKTNTNKSGIYEGEFKFINDEGTTILPIREKLIIKVIDSYVYF